ncbi:hypothetical protein, partial [Brucella anthropi]|uniref:hypothetical protein n=1 Tax=Brucella anthropi TaxID=529 RepID=UPI0034E496C1
QNMRLQIHTRRNLGEHNPFRRELQNRAFSDIGNILPLLDTARAKKIVFSGMFNAGAKLSVADGKLVIEKEGKLKKLVNEVE